MRRYSRSELVEFIKKVDELLDEPATLLIIGGAAATLRYGAERTTKDIDTWNDVPLAVLVAAVAARAATDLKVPIEKASVADAPYHYEDRVRAVSLRLKRLKVFVPERHDLALMKIVRGDRHDVDVIAEIHRGYPLKLDTLLGRFEAEMGHVIKDEKVLRAQFRLMIQRLFGPAAARKVAKTRRPGSGGQRI